VCVATCYNGLEFETGQRVVTRTCDNSRGVWIDNESGEIFEENVLPSCLRLCHDKLLTSTETVRQVSTSSVFASDFTSGPLPLLPLSDGAWRPATDDITQYIQVDLGSQHRLIGVVVRGDTVGSYVKLFRLLFSTNGVTWHPYSDGRNPDQNSKCAGHLSRHREALSTVNGTKPTYSLVFDGQGPATDITCEERLGVNVSRTLPACVTGFCLQEENDCHQMPNGDYQYCGNCHYFSTCSEGYFYVRPCPEHLVYDSLADLCNYKSSTCSTKSRLLCKRTRAHLSLPSFIQQNL
ncbi:hypothetical protein BaRGS_00016283, partial [Batillaria attramentaria]